MAYQRWCFTSFEEGRPFESLLEGFNYIVFQQEKAPDTGKLHYQGFFTLKKACRLGGLKQNVNSNWHFEPAKGNNGQNRSYCTKVDTRVDGPWEYGIFQEPGSKKRKNLELFQEDPEELRIADPKIYRRCLAYVTNQRFSNVQLPTLDRPWQLELSCLLQSEPDKRTIYWVFGNDGNEGKTTYAESLIKQGWFYTRGGKTDDITYQYIEHGGHMVFDVPREKEEVLQYNVLEMVKDRHVTSNKYEPVTIHYDTYVHVVVMANFMPRMDDVYCQKTGNLLRGKALSEDRLVIIKCNPEQY